MVSWPADDGETQFIPIRVLDDVVETGRTHRSARYVPIVKWNGMMVFGEDYSSSYVYHVTCVPDTGTAELDESMFDGIPDTAFCSMCLLRGDIDNIMVDEDKFRLLVESHDVLDFVLVRNIK